MNGNAIAKYERQNMINAQNPIANAPASWGIYWAEGSTLTGEDYLDAIMRAGYRATELGPYGFLGTDSAFLQEALYARGIQCIGAAMVHSFCDFDATGELFPSLERVGKLISALGTKNLVIMDESEFYPSDQLGQASPRAKTMAYDQIRRAQNYVENELGLRLYFHPHVGTFVELEAQIDELLNETEISLCFDTGHHAFWDQDPLNYLEKVYPRIGLVHLKNTSDERRREVWRGDLAVNDSFDEGVMVPLEDGVVDIAAVIESLVAKGYEAPFVIEQDLDRRGESDPEKLAAKNLKFVQSVLENMRIK